MASDLFVIGLSWRTAPVATREQLAFPTDELSDALAELVASPLIDEAVLLSTCNRVEVYASTARGAPASAVTAAAAEARSFLARSRHVSGEELAEYLYEKTDDEAIAHVFRVASALDSMVVGEAQILGQVKDAYGAAAHMGAVGSVLGRCMERSFGVAKRVRTETEVARGAANVSSVAVELAGHVFGDLNGKSVLVIGAGKMSKLAARHLRRGGASSIRVVNRSRERAEELAAEIEGEARSWDQLQDLFAEADVVISSTGAKEPVLTKPLVKKAMRKRRYRPVVVVDIAVPRDADPAIHKFEGVYLFDIDDLRKVVDRNLRERSKEAVKADKIIGEEVTAFQRWLHSQRVVPTIRSLREHFTKIAREEAEKVVKSLENQHSPEQRERAIRRLAEVIVNKLLHLPMNALKDQDSDVEALVKAAEALFDLQRERARAATQDEVAAMVQPKAARKTRGSS
ncbi:MAG: glutamyl-tRNA reductase [Deltaproteobacteria bacterium]|nr:glutamyl-tRNA reductase [Deltaproteobacteria bacterium]